MPVAGRAVAALAAAAGLALGLAAPATAAPGGGRPFTVELTGEAEVNAQGVPNQGDLDGTGTAHVTVNPGTGLVCWTIEVDGIEPVLAAHIHVAPSTEPGPVVVPLSPYSGGCTTVDRELAREIVRSPEDYYVNVHTATYPAGALRGQLG
ncbi:CHRD domain-containing protein [Agrococcus sp. HG114]|uniref:CHRD domain-containing protein n=1 Tax=Agrococcus sp. HG114 TaxID=2969757 RepID=UPI00215A4C78|nr:CHRD domain-containing protein [Agrococcus sp. HG114]MCR8671749.1 CHRD domain-containing protein [Agrococcus sp. HG114]